MAVSIYHRNTYIGNIWIKIRIKFVELLAQFLKKCNVLRMCEQFNENML